jgi:hypothetical protein
MNSKMLLAPILAVALVLSLAAAVSYLPSGPQASSPNQPTPQPSTTINWNATPQVPSPTAGSYNVATPAPTSTTPSTPVPLSGTTSVNLVPALSIAAAVILGIVAALVFFSERSLKKELGKDN